MSKIGKISFCLMIVFVFFFSSSSVDAFADSKDSTSTDLELRGSRLVREVENFDYWGNSQTKLTLNGVEDSIGLRGGDSQGVRVARSDGGCVEGRDRLCFTIWNSTSGRGTTDRHISTHPFKLTDLEVRTMVGYEHINLVKLEFKISGKISTDWITCSSVTNCQAEMQIVLDQLGSIYVDARATDSNGVIYNSNTRTFTVVKGPTASGTLTSNQWLESGSISASSVTFKYTSTPGDVGIDHFRLYVRKNGEYIIGSSSEGAIVETGSGAGEITFTEPGKYIINLYARGGHNNSITFAMDENPVIFYIQEPPELTLVPEVEGWTSEGVKVRFNYTSGNGVSEVDKIYYRMTKNGVTGDWIEIQKGYYLNFTNEGNRIMEAKVVDIYGRESYATPIKVQIDKTRPTGEVIINTENWQNVNSVTATLTAEDSLSGVKMAQYNLSGATTKDWTTYSNGEKITITNEGKTKIEIQVTDNVGFTYTTSLWVRIDRTAPTGGITVNTESWQNVASVTATLAAGDSLSGVKTAQYRLTGATTKGWTDYSNGGTITVSNEGETTIEIKVTDNAGLTYTTNKKVRLDRTNPTGGISVNTENWQNAASVIATLSSGDSLSGVRSAQYRLTGATAKDWTNYSNGGTISISNQGETTVEIKVTDNAGLTYTLSKKIRLDRTAPTGGISVNTENWQNAASVIATLNASDSLSGVKTAQYRLTGATTKGWTNYSNGGTITVSNEGETTIEIKVTDNAGLTYTTNKKVRLDRTNPTGGISVNTENWQNATSVIATLNASDNLSGVKNAQYRLTGATTKGWTNYSNGGTITVSNEGQTTIEIKVTDNVGLTYTVSKTVRIDRTNPTGGISVNTENWQNATSVIATLNVGDSLSGVKTAQYRLTGATTKGWTNYSNGGTITVSNEGQTTIEIKVTDNVGLTYTLSKVVRLDRTAPTGGISVNTENWQNATSVIATLNVGDSLSGVKTAQYRLTGATTKGWTNYSNGGTITISNEGQTTIEIKVTDNVGLTYTVSKTVRIDRTNPTGGISVNTENWQNVNSVTVTLSSGDSLSGVKTAQYRLTGATTKDWTNYSNGGTITVSNEGQTTIEIKVTDNIGLTYTLSKKVRIDRTAPTGGITVNEAWQNVASVTATLNAGDSLSGVRSAQYRLTGATTKDWTNYSNGNTITISNQGETIIEIKVTDNIGLTYTLSKKVRLDRTAPTGGIAVNTENWQNVTSVTATLNAGDSLSGVKIAQYRLMGATTKNWTNYSNGNTITISNQGETTIEIKVTDNVGLTYTLSKKVRIDRTAPTGGITVNTENWQNAASVTVTLNAGDSLSGVKTAQYQLTGATTQSWTNYSNGGTITISNQGETTITIKVTDNVGLTYTLSKKVRIDRTTPTGGITVNTENWQNVNSVTVTLSAGDSLSGVKSAQYRLTGTTTKDWTNYSNGGTITISSQGETTITIKVTDNVGLTYTTSKVVRIDRTNPTGSISVNHENWQNVTSVKATLAVSDSLSGVKTAQYRLMGATTKDWTNYSNGGTLTISNEGETTITIKVTDHVGLSYTTSKTVRIDRNAPTLSTTQSPASWTNGNVVVTAKATDNFSLWSLNAYDSMIGRYNYFSATQTKSAGKILLIMNNSAVANGSFDGQMNKFANQLKTLGFSVTTMKETDLTSVSQTNGYDAIFYLGWYWGPAESVAAIFNKAYENGIALFTNGNNAGDSLDIVQSGEFISGAYTVSKTSNNHLGELVHGEKGSDGGGYYKLTPISGVNVLANATHEDGTTTPYVIHYTNSSSTQWIHHQGENLTPEFINSVAVMLLQRNSALTTSLSHNFTVTENGSYPITVYDLAGNRTTVTHVVNTIDRVNPMGSIVIEDGKGFVNNEEVNLHLTFEDILSGNNAVSGVHTLRVFDVKGTYSATITNPTGTSLSIPWVLVPWEASDGALKAQVGVEITDRAGNSITVYSQVVEIIKVYVTKFELLNVLNPTVYNETNPFKVLTYPNIPPQPLLSGAHFTYHFEYYHPKNVNSKWKIDYISTVYYDKPNGQKEVWPIKDLKQSVTGMYSFQHIIPYHMPKGTKVYLDLQLVLYDASGRKVAEGHFPQPMNTSLYLGQIEGDIRETLQFNEFN